MALTDTQTTTDLRRRHKHTSSNGFLEAVKAIEEQIETALLLVWDDLPEWRRDNSFIHTGYRQTSNSYRRSFASLFSLHNESVNIWTHFLGSIVFSALGLTALYFFKTFIVPRYSTASTIDVLVFACFFAGAFICLGMSATFHALCNHSPEVARWGNKLDYTGIVFLIVGSYVPALYYGFYCLPDLMELYLIGIFTLGLGCLAVSWIDQFRTPAWRPYRAMMFVGLGVSGVGPVIHGLDIFGFKELDARMGLRWVLLQGGLYILGAFLYAVRWPERMFPKRFDIWGSSHQIFHVLILCAAASHLYGMVQAFDFHNGELGPRC